MPTRNGSTATTQSSGGRMGVDQFLAGLREHESDNRNAINPNTSASGYYQYTDSTWGGYGGYDEAHKAPFGVQHKRARQDALSAYDQHGDWERVAMNHFYPAWADEPKSQWNSQPAPHNPTGSEFVSSVMSNSGQSSGGSNGNAPPGQSSMDFEVPDYPSTPAPLPASSVRDYAERRRQASRNLESALAKRERGEAQQSQKLERTKERLEREAEEAEDTQRAELSAAGMARQPRGIGRALRDIQTDRSEALSDAQFDKSQQLAALDFAVNQARNERDRTRSNIRADKATERTQLDRLIGGSG